MNGMKKNLVWKCWPPKASKPAESYSQEAAAVQKIEDAIEQIQSDSPPAEDAVLANGGTEITPDSINKADQPESAEAETEILPEPVPVSSDKAAAAEDAAAEENLPRPFMPGHGGGYKNTCPHTELARAYIVPQEYGETFNPREALCKGTLFPELYRPYSC